MTRHSNPTRRQFLRQTAGASAAALSIPYVISASSLGQEKKDEKKPAASDRITVGVIGSGNMGLDDIRGFLGDAPRADRRGLRRQPESPGYWNDGVAGREPARRLVEEHYAADKKSGTYKGCDAYVDFRELLGRKDIDAVDGLHAGPLARHPGRSPAAQGRQGHLLPEAAVADHRRGPGDERRRQEARARLPDRQPAALRHATSAAPASWSATAGSASCTRSASACPAAGPTTPRPATARSPSRCPKGFDYDLWLGPAPKAPYAPARCHVNFRWIYDYSGGQVTDWGGHHPDCAQWGMGTEHTGPVEIRNAKGVFPPDELWNTATEYYFEAIYASGVKMIVSNKERDGRHVGRERRLGVGQPRPARRQPQVDPRIEDRPERDPPLREQQPLPQLHRLRALAQGAGRAGGDRPIARSRSATWATSPCAWAATS